MTIDEQLSDLVKYFKDRFGSANNKYFLSVFQKYLDTEISQKGVEEKLDAEFVSDGILTKHHDLVCNYCHNSINFNEVSTCCHICERELTKSDVHKLVYYKFKKGEY